jgi:phage shock protein PspC (stress-responsive transcriptional regulator)
MKKVININFHSRVIPIEESAYEILKQYSDSLRKYFANEEGRDEIINDIESRIAELFSEHLKKGANCITDEDVTSIINSMGRPEDFEAADADNTMNSSSSAKQQSTTSNQQEYQKTYSYASSPGRGKLYRNADDKILGGVCSGLANYLGIDPVILRIIFVLLFGALLWVYILLWIIVPSQSLQSNVTKRLFRSADDKIIGGVAGGLAAYFNIQIWIPRLIFALPFVLGLASGIFHAAFWNWDYGFGPRFISGGLGSTLILTYIILWIAVPVATTASEKLEMRGEKVDLNSIANTIKEDLEGFKGRMDKVSTDIKEGAQRFSTEFKSAADEKRKAFSAEMSGRRNYNSGFGHVIGVLFKAFFLFIAGIVALALFAALIGLLFGGMAVFPLKNFLLAGNTENMLAWCSLILFLGVPLVALITWLIRRIMGARSRNHYLGYVFASLWVIGLVCTIVLFGMFARSFRTRDFVEEDVTIAQPAKGKLLIDVMNGRKSHHYYSREWYGIDWDNDWPLYGDNYDTLLLNTVRVNLVKSKDSSFHVHRLKFSRGRTQAEAQDLARKINFEVEQEDSILLLPNGFGISQHEKFRNQQLLLVVEVPIGKKIEINGSINNYNWFTININHRNGFNIRDYDESDDWGDTYGWRSNTEYIMTKDGLQRTNKKSKDDEDNDDEDDNKVIPATPKNDGGYRYKSNTDSTKEKNKKDSIKQKDKEQKKPAKEKVKEATPASEKPVAKVENNEQVLSPVYLLATLFQ